MNRRGFLGTLFGAALAGIVGPFSIASPSQEVWKAAPSLPVYPRINEFVTLQQMVARTIEIVDQETKWLRLKRVHDVYPRDVRLGDTVRVREVQALRYRFGEGIPMAPWVEHTRPIPIIQEVGYELRFEPDEIRGRTLPEFSVRYLEPAAHTLAEGVIRSIRAHGGGEYMVSVDQRVDIAGIPKAAVVRSEAEEISIRGIHLPASPYDHGGQQVVRLDMLFGVA